MFVITKKLIACRLTSIVQEFIINKGGTMEAALSFQIQQHYAKLKLDVDISNNSLVWPNGP
jgi:hypothetical protein